MSEVPLSQTSCVVEVRLRSGVWVVTARGEVGAIGMSASKAEAIKLGRDYVMARGGTFFVFRKDSTPESIENYPAPPPPRPQWAESPKFDNWKTCGRDSVCRASGEIHFYIDRFGSLEVHHSYGSDSGLPEFPSPEDAIGVANAIAEALGGWAGPFPEPEDPSEAES